MVLLFYSMLEIFFFAYIFRGSILFFNHKDHLCYTSRTESNAIFRDAEKINSLNICIAFCLGNLSGKKWRQ